MTPFGVQPRLRVERSRGLLFVVKRPQPLVALSAHSNLRLPFAPPAIPGDTVVLRRALTGGTALLDQRLARLDDRIVDLFTFGCIPCGDRRLLLRSHWEVEQATPCRVQPCLCVVRSRSLCFVVKLS